MRSTLATKGNKDEITNQDSALLHVLKDLNLQNNDINEDNKTANKINDDDENISLEIEDLDMDDNILIDGF